MRVSLRPGYFQPATDIVVAASAQKAAMEREMLTETIERSSVGDMA